MYFWLLIVLAANEFLSLTGRRDKGGKKEMSFGSREKSELEMETDVKLEME